MTVVQATTRRAPGRPRSGEADRAILDAALTLFAERGFDNVSIDDIAGRAGVSRMTVYRRWTSKAALIAEAIASKRGAPEVDVCIRGAPTEQLLDTIAEILTAPEMKRIMARLIGASADHPEFMAIYWGNYMEPRRAAVLDLLTEAQAAGQIPRRVDLSVLLDIVAGVIAYQVLVRPGERTAGELKSQLVAALKALGIANTQDAKPEQEP